MESIFKTKKNQGITFGNIIKVLPQTGKTEIEKDTKITAKLPGKRISKTGKIYWETRKNRSDMPFEDI